MKFRKKPSLWEIDDTLNKSLGPAARRLEGKRFWLRVGVIGQGIAVAAFALPFAAGFLSEGSSGGSGLSPVWNVGLQFAPFAFVPLLMFSVWAKRSFTKDYKQEIMIPLAARFFPDLQYRPESYVSKNFYDEAGLFRSSLDVYTGNDFFSGRLGEVDFQYSELLCQYTSGSGKKKTTHTAFRGIYFVGDFHRDFYFRTTIQPDAAEKFFGVLGRGLQRLGSSVGDQKLVDLEDPEFEKMFVVSSSDQVEARFILTPLFMEKLKTFQKEMGDPVSLCFVNGKMHLFVSTGRDYFEPRAFGELINRKDLMEFIETVNLMIGIAEEFLHHPKIVNPPKMGHPPLPKIGKLPVTKLG